MWFCSGLPNVMQIGYDERQRSYAVILIYKMAANRRKSTSGFWFGHVWHLRRSKLSCQHTKFWPSQCTTFGFWKQRAAILKFYFRLRFWPFHCHRHAILQWPTKFYANSMNASGVMQSYWFTRWRQIVANLLPFSGLAMSDIYDGLKLSAY